MIEILLSKDKSRKLYFSEEDEAKDWLELLTFVAGVKKLSDSYEVGKFLGKG